jgi:hypothetical protein
MLAAPGQLNVQYELTYEAINSTGTAKNIAATLRIRRLRECAMCCILPQRKKNPATSAESGTLSPSRSRAGHRTTGQPKKNLFADSSGPIVAQFGACIFQRWPRRVSNLLEHALQVPKRLLIGPVLDCELVGGGVPMKECVEHNRFGNCQSYNNFRIVHTALADGVPAACHRGGAGLPELKSQAESGGVSAGPRFITALRTGGVIIVVRITMTTMAE